MTLHGRNAPCPCGSGRKFKHCCLPKPRIPMAAYSAQERQDAFAKLVRFSRRAEFADHIDSAKALFWAGRLELAPDLRGRELEADEHVFIAFLNWFLFDLDLSLLADDEPRGTIAARFLEGRGATLTWGERTYLERMSASCLRPYEIVEVRLDEGLGLRDLWTDQTIQVRERLATHQLARWDILAVRVIEGPDGAPVLDGVPYTYPAGSQDTVLAALRRHHGRVGRELATDDPAAFFKRVGMLFHHLWLDLVALRPMPRIVTAEGDDVTFAKVVFDMMDRATVETALARHPALDCQDDGSYVWLEPTSDFDRALGTFVLTRNRLTFETTSEARAERGRTFVEDLLGAAVRYRVTRYEDLEQALARAPRHEPAARSDVPPELEPEVVTAFYDRHYRSWLDEPIPALDGRTPRKAARLKTGRPKVVALLKQLENSMERQRREGRPAVELGWMWDELGLERP